MATLALTQKQIHRIGAHGLVLASCPALTGVGTWDEVYTGLNTLLYADVQYDNASTEPKIEVNMKADGTATGGWFRIKGEASATGRVIAQGR